jgi:hypothetical protein
MKLLISIILTIVLSGCGNKNKAPAGVLNKEKMTVVMWDLLEANSYTQQYLRRDTLKNSSIENMKMQQQIFNLHKVTKEDFYKSYDYYSTQPDQMKTLLDSIVALGERNKIKMIEQQNRGEKSN